MNEKFKIEDFGFREAELETGGKAEGEDILLRIFANNPKLFDDIFRRRLENGDTDAASIYNFFERNPDIKLKLMVNGKDTDKLIADFKSAIDKLIRG